MMSSDRSLETLQVATGHLRNHVRDVRSLFEQPDWYFSRRAFDVRIRVETVQELVAPSPNARVLDIGCGDGSLSLPLLRDEIGLTLLDVSERMLELAQSRTPTRLAANVTFVNDDFMRVPLEPASYDTILCVGVLAHVESPNDVIAKVARSLKPGGVVIVECTDSTHFFSRLVTLIDRVRGKFRPAPYTLQPITFRSVKDSFRRHQLQPVATFRYGAPFPGIHRLFSQETLYRLSRWVFGTPVANRNRWLGNEYIAVFSARSPQRHNHSAAVMLGVIHLCECLEPLIGFATHTIV